MQKEGNAHNGKEKGIYIQPWATRVFDDEKFNGEEVEIENMNREVEELSKKDMS